jgi:hypothetical protein
MNIKHLSLSILACALSPYDEEGGDVMDVSGGSLRRLIRPLIPCGKPNYFAGSFKKAMKRLMVSALTLASASSLSCWLGYRRGNLHAKKILAIVW